MGEKCESHHWNDGKKYFSIGRSSKPKPEYKLPYIVVQCQDCGTNLIYDEAGNYYEFKEEPYTG